MLRRVTKRRESKAAPARLTSRTTLRPSAAVRFGLNPSVADPGDHRTEHHQVEQEGAADGDQLDPIHPVRRRRRIPCRQRVEDEREDDQQQGVEDAEQVAVERVAEFRHGVDDGRRTPA